MQDDNSQQRRRIILSHYQVDIALEDAHKQSIIERKNAIIERREQRIAELEAVCDKQEECYAIAAALADRYAERYKELKGCE